MSNHSNVRSTPLHAGKQTSAARADVSAGCLGIVGIVLLLVSVGPLFLLLNGGYSIVGMAWLANHIGEYGRLFWTLATIWTVEVPIAARAGLPVEQPILPWMMVIGISFLEIALLLRHLRHRQPEMWLDGGGSVVALFDYATTAIGLVFAPFATNLGVLWYLWAILAFILALPVTFGFEGLLARVLRGR